MTMTKNKVSNQGADTQEVSPVSVSATSHIMTSLLSLETLTHAVAGTVGGFVTMTAFYPLDLIRSNMQAVSEFKGKSAIEVTRLLMSKSQTTDEFKGKSPAQVLKLLIQSRRILALYKGLGPILLALACSNFTYFYVNNLLKLFVKLRSKRVVTIWENILLNIVAGCVNVLVTNPIWVISTRLKLQQKRSMIPSVSTTTTSATTTTDSSSKQSEKELKNSSIRKEEVETYKGVIDAFTKIVTKEGVAALWNGTIASLILVLNPTIQFVMYDKLKAMWLVKKKSLNVLEAFILAALAKLFASCVTYPVQTVQAKIRIDKTGRYKNTIQCFNDIIKKDGVMGLFQGLDVNVIQKVAMAAFHFTVYERILSIIFTIFRIKTSTH